MKNDSEKIQEHINRDVEFALDGLLIDSGIITGDPRECSTEVGKIALDIFRRFEIDLTKITFGDVQDLVYSQSTQIGNPGNYLAHIANTAGILRSLVRALEKIHKDRLIIPRPDAAYAIGLVHDLNATFSDYSRGGQQSKEFDEFLLAKKLRVKTFADNVAMHSDYIGGIRLMSKGVDFPKKEAYHNMIEVLNGNGPLSYTSIENEFREYLGGKDRLALLLLTVCDYMENGQPHFDVEKLNKNFEARSKDIIWRYHGKVESERKTPSLLGQALVTGGMERIELYKRIIETLLKNEPQEIEKLEQETNFFHE